MESHSSWIIGLAMSCCREAWRPMYHSCPLSKPTLWTQSCHIPPMMSVRDYFPACPDINIPSVRGRSVHPINISSVSHTIEAFEIGERFTCQKASPCRGWKVVKMAMASSSSESGYSIIQVPCIFTANCTSLVIKFLRNFVQEKTLPLKMYL